MDGEGVGLHEGPDVHQDVEPLASGQLPLVVLSLGRVASSGLERGPAALVELVDPILDRAVGGGGCLLGLRHGGGANPGAASRPSRASRRAPRPPTPPTSRSSPSPSSGPDAPRTATSSP